MNIIFLHGLGQSPSSWSETISYLPEDTKAYCPDLFGFCKDGEITYKNIYCGFEEYVDQFSEPVTICGVSLGAVLALNYAVRHDVRIHALILIAPQYKMPKTLLKFQNILFHVMPEKFFSGSGLTKHDMIRLTNSMMTLDFEMDLDLIFCPSLIICGERDWANKEAAKTMAEIIPDAKLCSLDNAGHEINITDSKKLADALLRFLSDGGL